jgi:hypothetical protein
LSGGLLRNDETGARDSAPPDHVPHLGSLGSGGDGRLRGVLIDRHRKRSEGGDLD